MAALILFYNRSERHERELRELKELLSEWYSDYRDTENAAPHGICKRHRNSRENEPEDIRNHAHRTASVLDFLSEREKRKPRELKALPADGNAHNRDAPQAPRKQPRKSRHKASKYEP